MSDYTVKSNPALDAAIRGASSVEEIRELTLASLAASGAITRDRVDPYDVRLTSRAPMPLAPAAEPATPVDRPMQKASDTWSRYLTDGNSHFELFGTSKEDLDSQESRIRAILRGDK